jgi:osmotically-inducible protein OsmY
MKSDAQLMADVMSELAWDPATKAVKVGVGVMNGVVTLTERLDTHADKHAVERAVRRVGGDVKVAHRWAAPAGEAGWNQPHSRAERSVQSLTGTVL